jgi:hypothetical protein
VCACSTPTRLNFTDHLLNRTGFIFTARREALQEGDYAHAFWLCVQCGSAMGALGTLRCAARLSATVDSLYDEAAERLETALQAACADFHPDSFCKASD